MKRNLMIISAVILVVIIGVLLYALAVMAPEMQGDPSAPSSQVPVSQEYPGKVVYSFDQNTNIEDLRQDCTERSGTFSECGSICAPDAEICAEVCAYTCEY